MSITSRARESLRRFGFDVVRFPHPHSLGAHLRQLLRRLDIACVLDVGGHYGEYARFLRGLGYRGAIHSFEPVAASYEELARRLRDDPAWTGHRVALGNLEGEVEMRVTHSTEFSSVHRPTRYAQARFGDATTVESRVRVPMRRLDSVLGEIAPPGSGPVFLKLDTQGSDLDILESAADRLDVVAAIQAELSLKAVYEGVPPLFEVLPRLGELGFEPSGFFPVSIDRGNLALIEVDCVAVRTEPHRLPRR